MTKLTHKQKVRKARRMMTEDEKRAGKSIFMSMAWNSRKSANHSKERSRWQQGKKRQTVKKAASIARRILG